MYFLECEHCGHRNEVLTETMLFCSACSKKIANNFTHWHAQNPEHTFEDYKRLACTPDAAIVTKTIEQKPTGHKIVLISIIFFVVALIVAGYFFGSSLTRHLNFEKAFPSASENKWTAQEFGSPAMVISAPFKLMQVAVSFPPDVTANMSNVSSYQYDSGNDLIVIINTFIYKPEVGSLDLQAIALGTVNDMKKQPGIFDVFYKEEYKYNGSLPGFIQHGNFIKGNTKTEFVNAGYVRGPKLWQVLIGYNADNDSARQITERIMRSIYFKTSGEE